ncbi:MAG: histidine phosphatase family protein [Kiloniellales bacterium]|nr:histidine phosphatase family protein [Kiloniellales bacterium]
MDESLPVSLFVLRHGPTAWNEEGRIQGRSDIPLSPAGESLVSAWRLPRSVANWVGYCSPLARTCRTADLLGLPSSKRDDRLIEMSWGEWEGRSLSELRTELGEKMSHMESLGLDFRPPGGESPRLVQERLKPLLSHLSARGRPAVIITHKGVLRALYALASNWDMAGKPSVKLRDGHGHFFRLLKGASAAIGVSRLNVPLIGPGHNDAG